MQIVLHTGVHFTDEERLIKSLLKNKAKFGELGISVPGPSTYRKLLRDTADRILLSNTHFFGAPRMAVRHGQFYPNAIERLAHLRKLFHSDDIEICMGLRNPVSFLPAVFEQVGTEDFAQFLNGYGPEEFRWSDMLSAISNAVPGLSLRVWCNEDTPLIWEEIIRDIAEVQPNFEVEGAYDLIADIMTPEGLQRMLHYLQGKTGLTDVQKRRVVAAFLDKYAIEDQIEEELDIPGITDAMVTDITDRYDEDMDRVARIPGVAFIAP